MKIAAKIVPVLFVLMFAISCETGLDPVQSVERPIIGGTAVTDGSWPAVGAVTLYPDSMCTGTLIAPRVVVTAAHCVKGENPTKFTFGYDMDNGTDYEVEAAYYNDAYDEGYYHSESDYDPGSGDVAVLVLKDAVTDVTPAEIFTGDFTKFDGEDMIFVGYGKRAVYQSLYGLKYQVTLTIEDIDADGFWNYTTEADTHNTCGGDSGGPGFILSGGKYYIGGFVSSGDELCVEDGYNMRADSNAVWLQSMIDKYGEGVQAECGNGTCETGEDSTSCPDDCNASTDIWTACGTDYSCPDNMLCVQVGSDNFCTIACTDFELGGGCGYEDMACYELDDGSGACIRDNSIECGDGECVYGETATSCAADCNVDCGDLTFEGCCDGTKAVYCDNGQYRAVECGPDNVCGWVADGGYYFCTEGTATADPSGTLPMSCDSFTYQKCGDGSCNGNETTATCAADCPAAETCGNGTCDNGETTASCAADCPADTCGNGTCDDGETTASCAADCPADNCGNGTCDDGETTASCAADCPADNCGNGTCEVDETTTSCAADCKTTTSDCGNDICETGEDCRSCAADCGACAGDDITATTDVVVNDAAQETDEGTTVADDSGDGCSAGNTGSASTGLFMVLALGFAVILSRRVRRATR